MKAIQEAAERLIKIFTNPKDNIEFVDERGDGRHFELRIISDHFTNKSQIDRQRLVYDQLADLIKKDAIHALRMDLKTHDEAAGKTSESETDHLNSKNQSLNTNHDLHKLITKAPIMLFVKGDRYLPQCGFSARIMELLDTIDVEYETFDILEDQEVREDLKEFSNWPTYPQLYVHGKLIGGLDITEELYEKEELEKLLKKTSS